VPDDSHSTEGPRVHGATRTLIAYAGHAACHRLLAEAGGTPRSSGVIGIEKPTSGRWRSRRQHVGGVGLLGNRRRLRDTPDASARAAAIPHALRPVRARRHGFSVWTAALRARRRRRTRRHVVCGYQSAADGRLGIRRSLGYGVTATAGRSSAGDAPRPVAAQTSGRRLTWRRWAGRTVSG
jgi:hypothetical protein